MAWMHTFLTGQDNFTILTRPWPRSMLRRSYLDIDAHVTLFTDMFCTILFVFMTRDVQHKFSKSILLNVQFVWFDLDFTWPVTLKKRLVFVRIVLWQGFLCQITHIAATNGSQIAGWGVEHPPPPPVVVSGEIPQQPVGYLDWAEGKIVSAPPDIYMIW